MPRYIDADTLKIFAYKYCSNTDVMNAIDHCPEADVQEVKHGIWKNAGFYGFSCSACGEHICMPEDHIANYCPNCGAKMDGGAEK